MAYLTNRSCPDLTKDLDEAQCIEGLADARLGGFGYVSQGMLTDGRVVALKRVIPVERKDKLLKVRVDLPYSCLTEHTCNQYSI
jgi:hypothetical protein